MFKLSTIVITLMTVGTSLIDAKKGLPDFEWEDCGGSIFSISKIDLDPKPLLLKKGHPIVVDFDSNLKEQIPEDAKLDVIIKKKGLVRDLVIPCKKGLGSCKMNFCELFEQSYAEAVCSLLLPDDSEQCSCQSLKPGDYNFDDKEINIDPYLEKTKPVILKMAQGHYNVQIKVTDSSESEVLGCLKLSLNINA